MFTYNSCNLFYCMVISQYFWTFLSTSMLCRHHDFSSEFAFSWMSCQPRLWVPYTPQGSFHAVVTHGRSAGQAYWINTTISFPSTPLALDGGVAKNKWSAQNYLTACEALSRPPDHSEDKWTEVVWTCDTNQRTIKDRPPRDSLRDEQMRQTEEEAGRQHWFVCLCSGTVLSCGSRVQLACVCWNG